MASWLPGLLMSWLSKRRAHVARVDASDPLSTVRWIAAADNPFGVDILDCRIFSGSMVATTEDPEVAQSYVTLRGESGAQYRGQTPVDARAALFDPDPYFPVAAVDYLIQSHLYRMPVPHPFPKSLGLNSTELAFYSFAQYGRYARFGTFADTTTLQLPTATSSAP